MVSSEGVEKLVAGHRPLTGTRGINMKMYRDDMPDRLNAGGVRIQCQDWGELNASHIHFPAGADAKPLL